MMATVNNDGDGMVDGDGDCRRQFMAMVWMAMNGNVLEMAATRAMARNMSEAGKQQHR